MAYSLFVTAILEHPGYTEGMTRKIGISLPDDLYTWIQSQVDEGRGASVSGVVADAVYDLRQRIELEALVADLIEEFGEPGPEDEAWVNNTIAMARTAREKADLPPRRLS
jgi:Arc/MetJ-type ribon-helix-helix transcriptional regulator